LGSLKVYKFQAQIIANTKIIPESSITFEYRGSESACQTFLFYQIITSKSASDFARGDDLVSGVDRVSLYVKKMCLILKVISIYDVSDYL
jgi:hypothetical protein